VGLGGGSVLDTAKAIAVLVNHEGNVYDLFGQDRVVHSGLPTILLPTTAGTGAEITPNALFYIPDHQAKEAIVSQKIIPNVVIIDPMLTITSPTGLTAATGMDALCHAIESYTGLNATPLSKPFSREAIRLIGTHLRAATIHGGNLIAREGMALGSLNAAIAIANAGTNGVHALAYPLQGLMHIQHGIANSLLLPYVLEFNMLGNVELFAEIAGLLGVPTCGMSHRQAAEEGVNACRQLSIDIGIPQKLHILGIKEDDLEKLVDGAVHVTRLLKNNPRPIDREDIRRIFYEAF
jgi:alcohol dehydrogenase